MSVTIKDIAKDTGFSLSTISKYLNNGNLREKNRIKIEESINRLHFYPSRTARGLRRSCSYTIGVIIPTLAANYYINLTEELEKQIHASGYSILISSYNANEKELDQAIKMMISFKVDGIVIANSLMYEDPVKLLVKNNIPTVLLESSLKQTKLDCILSDNIMGSYEAIKYLIEQNYRRIAIITGNLNFCSGKERLLGYKRALEDYEIPFDNSLIYYGDYSVKSGYQGTLALMKTPTPPDALFIANMNMGEGAISALKKLSISIPDQIGYICFDDYAFSLCTKPTLTAVKQPIKKIAQECITCLIKRIEGDTSNFPIRKRIPCKLIIRESV